MNLFAQWMVHRCSILASPLVISPAQFPPVDVSHFHGRSKPLCPVMAASYCFQRWSAGKAIAFVETHCFGTNSCQGTGQSKVYPELSHDFCMAATFHTENVWSIHLNLRLTTDVNVPVLFEISRLKTPCPARGASIGHHTSRNQPIYD